MTSRVAYADSSALTKLFVLENETAALRRFLSGEISIVTSSLARVEVKRALRRAGAGPDSRAAAQQLFDRIHMVPALEPVLDRAEVVGPGALRTLDAIHLATALEIHPRADLFLCYDERLGEAARLHGLNVVSPGRDEIHDAPA